jgi:uncharacterized membrane protein YagU involved in acid resistance
MPILLKGVLSGLAGTAAMTVHQRLRQGPSSGGEPSWADAPAPAQVARKLLGLVGVEPPAKTIPLLTNAMHWGYGTTWGVAYALLAERAQEEAWAGPAFGLLVWAMSYVELVPMGIYEPPWAYEAAELADDVGYHLTYGTATALAHRVLAP